jgi:hypothetical protein
VDIFLWKHAKDIRRCTDSDAKPRPLHSVPQLLEHVLATYPDTPQTLEFFLPRELISEEVDQWAMTQGVLLQTKFGIEYQVVVRALDRLTPCLYNQFRERWQQRWKQLHQVAQQPGAPYILICDRDEYAPQTLYRTLLLSPDTTCLGLTFIPIEPYSKEDIFCAMLQAGIPVALWSRSHADTAHHTPDVRTKIAALVAHNAPGDLPRVVHRERQQANDHSDTAHLGNHLTLLWDDPNRVPPHWLLTTPWAEGRT